MRPTAFGEGIAISHRRLEQLEHVVIGPIGVPGGVTCDALAGTPLTPAAFIMAPAASPAVHIRLLSELSGARRRRVARSALLEAIDAGAFQDLLPATLPKMFDYSPATSQWPCLTMRRGEAGVPPLIRFPAGLCSWGPPALLKSHSAGPCLSRLPLFAEFRQNSSRDDRRPLLTVVDRKPANEASRRFQPDSGNTDRRADIILSMQDLDFAAGALAS